MPPRASRTGKKSLSGKRYPLNMRTTHQMRTALEAAANSSGRSLAQEAELRIERSFSDQRASIEALELTFGRELAGILLALGYAMREAGRMTAFSATRTLGGSQNWWKNPYGYSQAMQAASHILQELKPDGDDTPPKLQQAPLGGFDVDFAQLGRGFANSILEEAATGRTRTSGNVDRARILNRSIGPELAERLSSHVNAEWMALPYDFGAQEKDAK